MIFHLFAGVCCHPGKGIRGEKKGEGGIVDSSSVYLGVDADITVFGQAGVLMEGPELLQGIQVPILKVLQSTTCLNTTCMHTALYACPLQWQSMISSRTRNRTAQPIPFCTDTHTHCWQQKDNIIVLPAGSTVVLFFCC